MVAALALCRQWNPSGSPVQESRRGLRSFESSFNHSSRVPSFAPPRARGSLTHSPMASTSQF